MVKDELELQYDKQADAIYISLSTKKVTYTKKLDNFRYVDFAADNTSVGVELLCVSNGVATDDLPFAGNIVKLLESNHIRTLV
jgi:uncharacterized protein YuzE